MIADRLVQVAACLCAEIEADFERRDIENDLCFCGVLAGDSPTDMTNGDPCGGFAWVRLAGAYPSTSVGQAEIAPRNCVSAIGIDFEVGIFRSFAITDYDQLPDEQEWERVSSLVADDVLLIWRALTCCSALDPGAFILGQYAPAGPEGGLVGGSWPVTMMVD